MSSITPPPQEATPLFIAAGVAGITAMFRVLYGSHPLSARYLIGAVGLGMAAGVLLQFICLQIFGESTLTLYASTAIGSGGGIFTDQILRRIKWFGEKKVSEGILDIPPTPVPVTEKK